jgi:hypothetical protein
MTDEEFHQSRARHDAGEISLAEAQERGVQESVDDPEMERSAVL